MRTCSLLLVLSLWLLVAPAVRADDPSARQIFERTLRSTCWVRVTKSWGTGSVVDRSRRLVLTSCHVILGKTDATVLFPIQVNGKVVTDRGRFEQLARPVRGKVIASSATVDLALIQLESMPDDVTEIKLAPRSAEPGDRLHSVGNGKANGGLFGYHGGLVRQVCKRSDSYSGVKINCRVLETQSPHNPGDSGGPTVNDRGELVGVTAAYIIPAQLMSFHIDVAEVREFLKSHP